MPDNETGRPADGTNGNDAASEARAAQNERAQRPSLLRRLAEAADGVPRRTWFVASYELMNGEHDIIGAYTARPEAQANVPSTDYGVFGPFESTLTKSPSPIDRFEIYVAEQAPLEYTGEVFDSFFWSESALRKFVLPYYARVVSPEYAIRIREAFASEDVIMMAHDPITEYQMIAITRSGPLVVPL
jgi:hypothetical protein